MSKKKIKSSEINFVWPEFVTVFALISQPGQPTQFLSGFDKNNLIAIPGGKNDAGEFDIFGQTLAREVDEEVNATLNPAKFGKPEFRHNLVLACSRPIVFCTDLYSEAYVHKPLAHARKGGKVKLRIVYRMFDIATHRSSQPVQEKDLKNPAYRRLDAETPGMREALAITLDRAAYQPDWIRPNRYNPAVPVQFAQRYLRRCLENMFIDPHRFGAPEGGGSSLIGSAAPKASHPVQIAAAASF